LRLEEEERSKKEVGFSLLMAIWIRAYLLRR